MELRSGAEIYFNAKKKLTKYDTMKVLMKQFQLKKCQVFMDSIVPLM